MRAFVLARATLISLFHASLLLFFVLKSNSFENACSQRYIVANGVRIARTLAMTGYSSIWEHQNVECCRAEKQLLSVALLKFDEIVDICLCNIKSKWLAHPCWIVSFFREISIELFSQLI